MKTIVSGIFLLAFSSLYAQQNAIKFQVGYGLPLGSGTVGTSTSSNSGSSYIRSATRGSFGSGTQLEVGYTRSLSGLLSLQMDVSYLFGKQYNTYGDSYTYQGASYNSTVSTHANFFFFSPQLKAKLGEGKFVPYASVGPVIGTGKMYDKGDYNIYDHNPYTYEFTYSGSVSVGAKTTVGVEVTQGKFGFFGQLTMVNMSYAPTKGIYTKYIYNGTDNLPNMNTVQKETSFVNSYDAYGQQDPNQPSKQLKQYYPLSSLSLNFGVLYHF
ncbi:MAG: hypothetical protein JST69_03345 [Bacteroidetes bacterium]|nr:hypothetical protein [Bacteroidota bacterium]